MVFDAELGRGHLLDAFEAFSQLEDSAASTTQEMMMVALVRALVARGLAGNLHRDNTTVRGEGFQRTINSSDPERWDLFERERLNLDGGQRVLMGAENSFDGALLLGASVHKAR